MYRTQGRYFTEDQIERIVLLLRNTEMTLPEIACRMRCSRSAIAAINRRFHIRAYDGKRNQWTLVWNVVTSEAVMNSITASESTKPDSGERAHLSTPRIANDPEASTDALQTRFAFAGALKTVGTS